MGIGTVVLYIYIYIYMSNMLHVRDIYQPAYALEITQM